MAQIGHVVHGSGPEHVLLLHGWFGDHQVYAPVIPCLDLARGTFAFMDQRGYGRSQHMPGAYSLEEIAQDSLDLADRLGWRRFHVAGHSMGGAAAQLVMALAPERIKSALLITPVPASGVPFGPDQLAMFRSAAGDDMARRGIIDFSTGNRLPAVWIETILRASRETARQDAFAAYFEAWAHADFAGRLSGNPAPTVVIAGEHDPALPAAFLKEAVLPLLPNARLETIANAGHYPMQETPVWLAGLINRAIGG